MLTKIRKYSLDDLPSMIAIWNEVVEDGIAFPQEELLDTETGAEFFAAQSYCGVADNNGTVPGGFRMKTSFSALAL